MLGRVDVLTQCGWLDSSGRLGDVLSVGLHDDGHRVSKSGDVVIVA